MKKNIETDESLLEENSNNMIMVPGLNLKMTTENQAPKSK